MSRLESRSKPILVFDMDGVLVEVTESYRETIARTVEHFTGARPTPARIQEYKNAGGWNDDWKLSHHMVREAGVALIPLSEFFSGPSRPDTYVRFAFCKQDHVLEEAAKRLRELQP